jgi:DNA-binding response OmpR family regulator
MNARLGTIGVADDNPILLQGLERALVAQGYDVWAADSGLALLRRLEGSSLPPDLLILDVMMPGMTGIELLLHLRRSERWAELPVIVVTAVTDEQMAVSALRAGAVDFLTKPFRLGELLARVEGHLARAGDLRRLRNSCVPVVT